MHLTFRSTRTACKLRLEVPVAAAPLRRSITANISPFPDPFIRPMVLRTAFVFSGAIQRLIRRFPGLYLQVACFLRAFLASGAFTASASSYGFASIASLQWRNAFLWAAAVFKTGRFLLAFGSGHSSQPAATRRPNSGREAHKRMLQT